MKDYLDFSEKTAVITGGRRGLGKAMTLFLASDLSNFVHGQTLVVDGGFTGN